jgi:hypothetical protein
MAFATTVQENDISINSTTVPVRLDASTLASRYWVRVINPQASLRIFIGHTSGTTNQTNCETVDPYNGVWEDSLGPNVEIWALAETGASLPVVVRVKQYA